jgi:pyrimidine-nucleoside phosphorylase
MRMVDLIFAKRTGAEHTRPELEFIVNGIKTNAIPEYQISAWLMAVFLRGLSLRETTDLTDLMASSGTILDLSEIGEYVVDKHSTGGLGDKTTLVFVPLLAAAGVPVAMLSGRGLGHTHGTVDKLEAIPGFRTDLTITDFKAQLRKIGMAIGAQTRELAPVDGKLYALRDVTATVESIPLITASILSKKIAAGANVIVIDVKAGSGAFMANDEEAIRLAETLDAVGTKLMRGVCCLVTDMNQPLGLTIGHTLEVIESIETLKGRGPSDLVEVCLSLASLALVKTNRAKNEDEGRRILSKLLNSGAALEKFKELIAAQGGDARVVNDYSLMPNAPIKLPVVTRQDGQHLFVKSIDGRKISRACALMGAGRAAKDDRIDLAVGIELESKIGEEVRHGEPIATIYGKSLEQCTIAAKEIEAAYSFSEEPVATGKLIKRAVVCADRPE